MHSSGCCNYNNTQAIILTSRYEIAYTLIAVLRVYKQTIFLCTSRLAKISFSMAQVLRGVKESFVDDFWIALTFTFSHLADAFVQSDVQGREYSSYEQ